MDIFASRGDLLHCRDPGRKADERGWLQGAHLCQIAICELESVFAGSLGSSSSAFQDKLLELYAEHPVSVVDFRANEVRSFVESGLQIFLCRTSFDWGVPVPFDESHILRLV